MKIIKYGKKPDDIEYVQKCPFCKSVFVYKESESTYEMDVGYSIDHYVKCPICEYNVLISLFRKKYNVRKHGNIIKDMDSQMSNNDKKECENEDIKETKILGFRGDIENDRTIK